MKKIAVFLILLAAVVFCISCENNGITTAPPVKEQDGECTKQMGGLSNSTNFHLYIFALDEDENEISSRFFDDKCELNSLLSEEIMEEMLDSTVSDIEDSVMVSEIKDMLFADLPTYEYLNIYKIGSVFLENLVGSGEVTWGCAKACGEKSHDTASFEACLAACAENNKDKGYAPYIPW